MKSNKQGDNGIAENLNLRSEEVQEIISKMPSWIVRYGITLLFCVFCSIISLTWFIKYPDVLKANIVITTNPPPLNLVSRNSGKIKLLKKGNTTVAEGELIAYIESSVNVEDLLTSEKELTQELTINSNLLATFELGMLQSTLNQLISANDDLQLFHSSDLRVKKNQLLNKQIDLHHEYNKNLESQITVMTKELTILKEKTQSDSLLKEQDKTDKIQASLMINQIEIQKLKYQILELTRLNIENEKVLMADLNTKKRELIEKIASWKENFLFISPLNGKLSNLNILENEKVVTPGEQLFSITPTKTKILGIAEISAVGSGKLRVNQNVNIYLEKYPSEQFGILSGMVEAISSQTVDNKYSLKITMPAGMRSSYNLQLPFQQQLNGKAEIITEDLSLFERLFNRFINVL